MEPGHFSGTPERVGHQTQNAITKCLNRGLLRHGHAAFIDHAGRILWPCNGFEAFNWRVSHFSCWQCLPRALAATGCGAGLRGLDLALSTPAPLPPPAQPLPINAGYAPPGVPVVPKETYTLDSGNHVRS